MRNRSWICWTVLFITACGSTQRPVEGAEPAETVPTGEPAADLSGTAPSPESPDDLPRCAAGIEAESGLDPAPSVHASSEPRAMTLVPRASPRGEPIGSEVYGFVWWRSANGRFALLLSFGEQRPQFGHHGEVASTDRELWLVDQDDGSRETISEMITVARGGGAMAYRDLQDRVWLLEEDGQRTDLSALGADNREDQNRCLNRRQVGFNINGTAVSWLARQPDRVIVQDLESGARCQVESGPGEIWRAHPMSIPGWTFIHEIPSDSDGDGAISFPVQQTSCACRWCNRFAMSMGYYGWGGDAFEGVLIAPDGTRISADGHTSAIGDDTIARAEPGTGHLDLLNTAGTAIALPSGCEIADIVPGSPSVLLECGIRNRLFFPDDGRVVALPARVQLGGQRGSHRTPSGHVWAPVRASTDEGLTWHIARLRMNDGRIETGPVLTSPNRYQNGPWTIGPSAEGVVILDLRDGALWTAEIPGVDRIRQLAASLEDGRTALLAPASGRFVIVEGEPGESDEEGCRLVPASQGERGVERGPWQRVCP